MGKKSTGFTLIEMLVGIVIGMIVVAAASVMMVSVLKSQKDVTASARLNQELGAAMAVMSNEIRRAGFRVCDLEKSACKIDTDGDGVLDEEVPRYNTSDPSDPNKDLEVLDGIASPNDGDCILYRYNADVDDLDDLEERRGFRLNGNFIQMAGPAGDVKCDDPADSTKWKNLTNIDVINVTALSFSTTGSKCRNMTLPDPNPAPAVVAQYWVVDDTATEMACDNDNSDTVDYCIVTEDLSDPANNITNCTGGSNKVISDGNYIFGTRQIRITLDATLTRDPAVTKNLESSVKVANPRVHCWPFSDDAACSP